jgi:hypothetical protein
MIIKRRINLSSTILVAIGLGLIFAGFFVIVPASERSAVAWLDLLVFCAVFLINFATLPLVRPGGDGFSREIPKLGILWTTHILYTSLALAGIRFGWLLDVSFRLQVLYHLVLFFGLLVILSVAERASDHAAQVDINEARRSDSLQTLKSALTDCDSAFLRSASFGIEYSQFQRIKEDVRYLSPCGAQSAVSLDLELACLLSELCGAIAASSQFSASRETVQDALTRCSTLVRLRKQERQS